MRELTRDFSDDLIRRSGWHGEQFARLYDTFRPAPPAILQETICAFAGSAQPRLVVDLGCGTGLSTRIWSGLARRVIGIEPNAALYELACQLPHPNNVAYVHGYSHETGIERGSADIVTCSQSLHWMPPEQTFAEVARMLRDGGVFAAYDYDVPPAVCAEIDAAFLELLERPDPKAPGMNCNRALQGLNPNTHLGRLRISGHFKLCREFLVHSVLEWDASDAIGFARSLTGDTDSTVLGKKLLAFERVANRVFKDRRKGALWSYRVRLGVR